MNSKSKKVASSCPGEKIGVQENTQDVVPDEKKGEAVAE